MAGEILDSGNRRQFSTGAVRDIDENKGAMYLVPLDIASELSTYFRQRSEKDTKEDEWIFNEENMFNDVYQFTLSRDILNILRLLCRFIYTHYNDNIDTAILEVSKQYSGGKNKYGAYNWNKGISTHSFIDSGMRHGLKVLRGDNDEPHDRAFMWNFIGLLWTLKHKPELDDIYYGDNYNADIIDAYNKKWNPKDNKEESNKQEVILEDVKSEEPSNITITTEDTTNKVYPDNSVDLDKSDDDKLGQEYLSLFFKFPSEVVELHDKYHDKFEGTKIPLVIVEASGKCEYYGLNSDDLLMNKGLGGIAIPCNKLKELIGDNYKTIIKVTYNENPSNIYISLDGVEYYFSNYEFESFLKYSNIAFNTDSDKTPITTSDTTASITTTEVKEDEENKQEEQDYIYLKLEDENAVAKIHESYTKNPNAYITITNLESDDSRTTLFLKYIMYDLNRNILIIPMRMITFENLTRKQLSRERLDLQVIYYDKSYKVAVYEIKSETIYGDNIEKEKSDYYLVLFFSIENEARKALSVISVNNIDKIYIHNLAYIGSNFELLVDKVQFCLKKNALIIPDSYLKEVSGNNWSCDVDVIKFWNVDKSFWYLDSPLLVDRHFKDYDLITEDEVVKDYMDDEENV